MRRKIAAKNVKVGMRGGSLSDMMHGGPAVVVSRPTNNDFCTEWIIEWENGEVDICWPSMVLWIEV